MSALHYLLVYNFDLTRKKEKDFDFVLDKKNCKQNLVHRETSILFVDHRTVQSCQVPYVRCLPLRLRRHRHPTNHKPEFETNV